MINIDTKEILCFWIDENYVNFDIENIDGNTYRISIHSYEFLQWFDKNTIEEIKTKLIENIKNK
jgi:protein tyrosine phosphatase